MNIEDNKCFSKREWFFLIAIIVLIQFIVQWLAFEYKDSSNALGYISFAGTIVSIILAVLAIMYSYIQSASQQTSSEKITSQVDKLVDVVTRIDLSKLAFSEELSKLQIINEKIDKTMNSQQELNANVSKLHGKFDDLNNFSSISSISDRQKDGEKEEIYEKPLASGINGISQVAIALYYAEQMKKSVNEALQDYIQDFWIPRTKYKTDKMKTSFFNDGYLSATSHMLIAYELLETEETDDSYDLDSIFKLNDEFRLEIKYYIESIKEEDDHDSFIMDMIEFCESKNNHQTS